ncbi:MAG: 6-pyruvoyl tetrahydropterin synthase family protein [Candidatus Hydrothermia bacterium]|nr:6-pyruvoyl tetrahydropterin synthase family protein [Candidatus Hydrothermia bacterium]
MFEVRWETVVDAAHRIFEHSKKCAFLHGHSYRIRVKLEGTLGEDGILVDFGLLKVKIHNLLDHKTILYGKDPLVNILQEAGQKIIALDRNPSSENIALLVASIILREFSNVEICEAEVFETQHQSGFVRLDREHFIDVRFVEY